MSIGFNSYSPSNSRKVLPRNNQTNGSEEIIERIKQERALKEELLRREQIFMFFQHQVGFSGVKDGLEQWLKAAQNSLKELLKG